MTRYSLMHVILLFGCLLMQPLFSLPSYERVSLPMPRHVMPGDEELLEEIVKLEVYRDTKIPRQYYFVPPFEIKAYLQGAASMVPHTQNVKNFAIARKELEDRSRYAEDFSREWLLELIKQKNSDEERYVLAKERLEEAMVLGNANLLSMRKRTVEERLAALEESTKELHDAEDAILAGHTLLPAGLGRGYFERALLSLALSGLSLPYAGGEDPLMLTREITAKIDALGKSYGGFLSVSATSGFSAAQAKALRMYKNKYLQDISLSLLPVDKISFIPLTEVQQSAEGSENRIFRSIKGAGDYTGVSVVMDASVAAATGFAEHLGPFILPVGLRATFKQQLEPAEAELKCDFSNNFAVRGRADVRDGLVIYDNDITNTMRATDMNHGACDIRIISGDPESAHFAGLKEMEREFEELRLHRVNLTRSEKDKYFNGVMDDIRANRRAIEPRYVYNYERMMSQGLVGVLLEGLTHAADFHWHTNKQNINTLSKVKFTKRVKIEGHHTVEKDLPTNFCLYYNSELRAYDKCSDRGEEAAKSVTSAIEEAHETPLCINVFDPFECGEIRDDAEAIFVENPPA